MNEFTSARHCLSSIHSVIGRFILAATLSLLAVAGASASTFTWDSDGVSSNGVSTFSGGQSWTAASANWFSNTSTPDAVWNNSNGDIAALPYANYQTWTLSSNFTVGGLFFNGSNTGRGTLASGTLTFVGAASITGTTGATISSVITGTSGITINVPSPGGVAAITLSGANTYTGATTVQNGFLQSATSDLPVGTTLVLGVAGSANSALDQTKNNQVAAISSLGTTLANDIISTYNNASGTLTVNPDGASVPVNSTFGGILQDDGSYKLSLAKAGSHTVTLSGANTYTGATTISGGSLVLAGSTGSLGVTALTFTGAGGTFAYDNTGSSGVKSQTMGALTFSGGDGIVQSTLGSATSGTLTFASLGTRTAGATGDFVFTDGTANNAFVITSQATGMINPGIFFSGTSYAYYDAGGFVRGINYGVDANTQTTTGTTAISSASGTNAQITGPLTAQTSGTFGTLNIVGANNVNMIPAGGNFALGSILKTGGGSSTIVYTNDSSTLNPNVSNGEIVIRTDSSTDALTIASQIQTGSITKSGAGLLTFTNNNSYLGITTIDGGVLAVRSLANGGGNSNIGATSSAATNLVINGGTLLFSGTTVANLSTDRLFTIGGTGATLDASGVATISFANAAADAFGGTDTSPTLTLTGTNIGNNTFASAINNNGRGSTALAKAGTGTWVLSGTSAYTGPTTVNAGELIVSGSLSGSASVAINNAGSTLQLGANSALNSAATLSLNSGTLDVNGHVQTLGALVSLTGSANILLDNNTASNLTVANSSVNALAWTGTLTIQGWSAAALGATGNDHIFFGSDTTGLSSAQLADVFFLNPTIGGSTDTGLFSAELLSNGELVALAPVPEPGTYGIVLLGLGSLIAFKNLRKRQVGT